MFGRVSSTGVLVATAFAVVAMTPPLLPRTLLHQGLVCGISAALGYGLGTGVWWVAATSPPVRRWLHTVGGRVSAATRRVGRTALLVACAVLVLVVLSVSVRWQQQLALAFGAVPPSTGRWLLAAPVLALLGAVLVLFGRAFRVGAARLSHLLHRYLRVPVLLAGVAATVLVAAGVGGGGARRAPGASAERS